MDTNLGNPTTGTSAHATLDNSSPTGTSAHAALGTSNLNDSASESEPWGGWPDVTLSPQSERKRFLDHVKTRYTRVRNEAVRQALDIIPLPI